MRYCEILSKMIREMECAEMTASISHNFIVKMIPHHEAAIEMSKNLLRFTTYIPLQCLANEIIEGQTREIEQMNAILGCCECESCESSLCLYERRDRQITESMIKKMENAGEVNNINLNFVNQMLPHHRGAVKMAKNALRFDVCDELKPMLESIICVQTEQIRKMEYLQRCLAAF